MAASLTCALSAGLSTVPTLPNAAAAATPRPASSAGADRIGSASYGIPATAVFVANWGSDSSAGTMSSPVRTLARALVVAPSSGTIVMRGGTYNESNAIYKTVTVQNYPGETVWLDGSTAVNGWVQDGARWRHDGWTTRFDHSPTYSKGAPDSSSPNWQFVNPASAPMAAHPDQIWLDGVQQTQAKSLASTGPNSFYLDEATSRLYVGSNPTAKQVLASNLVQALNIRAAGVVIRGIGIRRFANSVWHVGAITVEKPNATVDNVVVSEMATTGISIQSTGASLRKVTVERSGMLGIHARHADNLTITGVLSRWNNSEHFNIAPVSGGAKVGATRGVVVTNSSFSDNFGHGFWDDMSVYNSVFRGTNFNSNSGDGLFLEISARAVVGDSLFLNNKMDGIKVNNTSNVKIWNNTFLGNGRSIWLAQDARRNTNRNDAAVDSRVTWPDPEMPWQLDDITLSNNIIGLPNGSANCVLCVEDYSRQETAEGMRIKVNGNIYNRLSPTSPSWLTVWSRGSAAPATFTSLASFKTTTGQEQRGREYVGSAVVSSGGVLTGPVSQAVPQIALGLPADVATLIGRPTGTAAVGAWVDGSPIAPPAPPPPVPTPPVPPTPPAATTVARDSFARVVKDGWGTADVGGLWTIPAGSSQFATANGSGTMKLKAGDGYAARLDSTSSSRADTRVAFSFDIPSSTNGYYFNVIARNVSNVGDYRAKVKVDAKGAAAVWLVRGKAGAEAVLVSRVVNGLTFLPGSQINIRVRAVGTSPTNLQMKLWKDNTAEPTDWTIAATDDAAGLQTGGSIGIHIYSGGPVSGQTTIFYAAALEVKTVN